MPTRHPGLVNFPAGQVTFHSHLPNGQGPRKVVYHLKSKKRKLRLVQGKQNFIAACPKGKLEFMFFSSAVIEDVFLLTGRVLENTTDGGY